MLLDVEAYTKYHLAWTKKKLVAELFRLAGEVKSRDETLSRLNTALRHIATTLKIDIGKVTREATNNIPTHLNAAEEVPRRAMDALCSSILDELGNLIRNEAELQSRTKELRERQDEAHMTAVALQGAAHDLAQYWRKKYMNLVKLAAAKGITDTKPEIPYFLHLPNFERKDGR